MRGRSVFQATDVEAAFSDVAAYSESVHITSHHAELATLAMKNAIVGRDVAHLVLPDEVQVHPAGDEAAAGGPQGRTPLHPSAPSADAVRHAVEVAIAVDVGNNTYSFGRYFEASGQQDLVMSGHLGSIGFAFPAAMGQWALDHRGPALVEAVTNPLLVYHRDERAVPASDVAVDQCGGGGPANRVPGGSTAQSACAPQPPSNTTSVNGSRRTGP